MKYKSLKNAESKPQAHGATNSRQQVAQAWLQKVNQNNLSKNFKPSQNQPRYCQHLLEMFKSSQVKLIKMLTCKKFKPWQNQFSSQPHSAKGLSWPGPNPSLQIQIQSLRRALCWHEKFCKGEGSGDAFHLHGIRCDMAFLSLKRQENDYPLKVVDNRNI